MRRNPDWIFRSKKFWKDSVREAKKMKLGDTVKYCSKDSTTGVIMRVDGVVTKIDGDFIHVKVDDLPPITVIVHRNNKPGVSQDWIEQP